MAIPQSFLDQLKMSCDIETIVSSYVSLKRSGRTSKGLCPFHSEKTASFTVYHDSQSFFCYGCQKGGDVITFIREIEHLDYVEALRFLAERVGIPFPEEEQEDPSLRIKPLIYEINRAAAHYFHSCLRGEQGAPGREYLMGQRQLSTKTVTKYGLGYAPPGWDNLRNYLRGKGYSDEQMLQAAVVTRGRDGKSVYDTFRNRVIFPIIDIRKNVIGFGGRVLDDSKPKYLNSPDTPVFKKSRNLFSLNFAKNVSGDKLILAEGYMDVIAMNQAGFENVVATLGTALTPEAAIRPHMDEWRRNHAFYQNHAGRHRPGKPWIYLCPRAYRLPSAALGRAWGERSAAGRPGKILSGGRPVPRGRRAEHRRRDGDRLWP